MECTKAIELLISGTLTFATIVLAGFTLWLVLETKAASTRQLGVNTWLDFIKRFATREMKTATKNLAADLSNKIGDDYIGSVGEEVLEFFEEVGIAYDERCIDRKLAHSSLSCDAQFWWFLAKPWIEQTRLERDDKDLYRDYENFINSMRQHFPKDPAITIESAKSFLLRELNRQVDRF